jgi:flavin-dependent dehydrogenase
MGFRDNKLIIKNLKKKTIQKIKLNKNDYLIGADGPDSAVRKYVDKKHKISHLVGVQARARLRNRGDAFEVFLDKAPGFFAWVVPENKSIVRIGLAAKEKPNYYFKEFLKSRKINDKQIIELQGGLIPLYNPRLKVQKENIYLVGDAASQVKASTGGGIIPGLVAAQCLSLSILYNLNYTKLLKKKLRRKLWLHLKLRKMLNKLSEKDLSNLTKLCNQAKVKTILKNIDRDKPAKLLLSLALKEPRFLLFGLKTITFLF